MSQTQKIVNPWYHFLLDSSHKPPNQFYGLDHARGLEAVRGANLSVLRWVDSNRGFVLKMGDAESKLIYALDAYLTCINCIP